DELIIALPRVNAYFAVRDDLDSILRLKASRQSKCCVPKKGASKRRLRVPQAEIDVPRTWPREMGDFAFHPAEAEPLFYQRAYPLRDLQHRLDLHAFGYERVLRCRVGNQCDTVWLTQFKSKLHALFSRHSQDSNQFSQFFDYNVRRLQEFLIF